MLQRKPIVRKFTEQMKTKKDDGAQFRHDARPSIQLPSVICINSKIRLPPKT